MHALNFDIKSVQCQRRIPNPVCHTLNFTKQLFISKNKRLQVIYKVVVEGETDGWNDRAKPCQLCIMFFACPLYINYSVFVMHFTWATAQSQLTLPKQPFGWLKNRLNGMRGLCCLVFFQTHTHKVKGEHIIISSQHYVSYVSIFCEQHYYRYTRGPSCRHIHKYINET